MSQPCYHIRALSKGGNAGGLQVLDSRQSGRQLEVLGELMAQSHASYGRCRLGSDGTDRIVALVRKGWGTGGGPGAFR
jgi:hypothetical protein